MSKEFEKYLAENPRYNLISKDKLALLKIKLGKSHRKESDWDIIKDIFSRHCLLVAEPMEPDARVEVREHLLVENGVLLAFTNEDDLSGYIGYLNWRDGTPDRVFGLGELPFDDAIDISERFGMDLYIDSAFERNKKFFYYSPKDQRIKVSILVK